MVGDRRIFDAKRAAAEPTDLGLDAKRSVPTRGLIPEAVLERPLRILLAEIDVDRFRIAGLDERVRAQGEDAF